MSRFLTLAALVVVATASVAVFQSRSTANASTTGDPRIAVLQKQVKTLQAQVKALQTQATQLAKAVHDTDGQIQLNFASDTCLGAQVADVIQGTWGVIDQIGQATQQKTYFGPQTQLSDYQNCSYLVSPSVPRPTLSVPPTLTSLQTMLQWLHE
jgi:hypothetical protein